MDFMIQNPRYLPGKKIGFCGPKIQDHLLGRKEKRFCESKILDHLFVKNMDFLGPKSRITCLVEKTDFVGPKSFSTCDKKKRLYWVKS